MGRLPNYRRVKSIPQTTYFKPQGTLSMAIQEICLSIEEAEAVRLKDLEGLEQEQCARSMRVSRPTFARILGAARRKIADAMLNGKAIRIDGGNFELAMRRFRCLNGHEWNVPFESMTEGPPLFCPDCRTPSIMPLYPPGFAGCGRGRGRRKGRNRNW